MEISREEGRKLLEDMVRDYGLPFRVEAFWDRLWNYLKALGERAEGLHLTAVHTLRERLCSQVLESLVLASRLPSGAFALADLGTGGGIPGLILKLVRPELEVVLYEAYSPRVAFLQEVVRELSLEDIRAEELHLGKNWPDRRFPVVVSRGYGSVQKFTQHAQRLLCSPGWAFYLWRNDAEPWGKDLDLSLSEKIEFELPNLGTTRTLLCFKT